MKGIGAAVRLFGPVSWIGKAGAGVVYVDGKVGGGCKNCVQLNHMSSKPQSLLITSSAGFIGSSLVFCLLESEELLNIVGLSNLNDYYDPLLKEYRLNEIQKNAATAKRHT